MLSHRSRFARISCHLCCNLVYLIQSVFEWHWRLIIYFSWLCFILIYNVVARQGYLAPRRTWRKERGRMTTRTTTDDTRAPQLHRAERQKSTEAKSAYKTT